ncbi:MAG: hypothetical protein ACI8W8_003989 [Rhodothermales bacterium]|jgi:hypothetical protein
MRLASLFLIFSISATAEPRFSSGSTGADGDLDYTAPPPARREFAMAYDAARGEMLLFGGDTAGRRNDTWAYDGKRWELRTPQTFPSSRNEMSMAYDSTREVIVLFGGFDGEIGEEAQDTWEWDGSSWTRIETATSPTARQRASMSFDSTRHVMVLYGGDQNGSPSADTWEYSGSNWAFISTANSPGPRSEAAMAYDPVRQQTVFFGGTESGGPSGSRDETWVYDGANWQQRSLASIPPKRLAHVAAWSASRGTVMMGFGVDSFGARNDFWEWNGTSWSELHPATTAPARSDCAMAFDEGQNAMLLFGGAGSSSLLDDTWLFAADWILAERVQSEVLIDMSKRADGVWNYRDVSLPAGVTLRFLANSANTPVTWLASGTVNVSGSIDLSGGGGASGPGGFSGGTGGSESAVTGHPGIGPAGGLPGVGAAAQGTGAGVFGAVNASPISGGSGGGGGGANPGDGGGGGGALLIAASQIQIDGSIVAEGGAGVPGAGGQGADGTIKLVANSIGGAGSLIAGRIRFETFSTTFSGSANPAISGAFPPALSYAAHLATLPNVRVVSVQTSGGELPVKNGSTLIFAEGGPVTVNLATTNIPAGTTLTVRLTGRGQVHSATSSGTDTSGNATADFTVPAGAGSIQAFAEFAAP